MSIRKTLDENNKCPNTLIKSSISEYIDYEKNAIVLAGLSREFNEASKTYVPSYASVKFGSYLEKGSLNFQKDNKRKEHMHRIDMSRMAKKNLCLGGNKKYWKYLRMLLSFFLV